MRWLSHSMAQLRQELPLDIEILALGAAAGGQVRGLNLDGGASSGLRVAGRAGPTGVDSWVKVPAVIVAKAR